MTDLRAQWDNVMVPNYSPMDMIPSHGEGSRVWSNDNKEYIDFAGGIAVNVLGHCHPELVKVLGEQSEKIWHLSNVYTNEPSIRLANLLCEHTFADKVYFANSGAEVNEAALKLARRYALEHHGENKNTIIAFNQGFHGRTFFTVTVGGQPSYSDGFGPKPGAIEHCEYNNIESFESLINENTCAVIMEPLQGEGGVIPCNPSFAKRVAELCRQYNALLIFDEVQSGVGRTGDLFAYMGLNVTPDILTTAKSLGGGFPIGAMLTTTNIAGSLKVGTHGSTYGGNALACAVAARTLELINQPDVLRGAIDRERYFRDRLSKINDEFSVFAEVRGKGMLLGCVLNDDYKDQAKLFMTKALEKGLMCLMAGSNVIRFAPSIIISYEDIELGLSHFRDAIADIVSANNKHVS